MRKFTLVVLAMVLTVPAHAQTAQQLFDAGKWPQAALALDAVRKGAPSSPDAELAQYHLGIALYRMHLLQAAYAIFSEISDKPNHRAFGDALPWLAKLATDLPEPADVVERIGKYTHTQIAQFDNPAQRDLYAQLEYLLGRYQYRNRQYAPAIDRFAAVGTTSKYWVPSQFFAGIANVQLRKSAPARLAFERVLDVGPGMNIEDAPRMRDLAHLSIARIEYSESIRTTNGELLVDRQALSNAVRQWGAIDAASEFWLDGVFEASWAYFMAGDYSHALGNIHTIQAPYFSEAYYPEADVLRAVIYFTQCQYEDAALVVGSFQRQYQPVYGDLAKLLARFRGDDLQEPFFKLLQRTRRGAHIEGTSSEVERIVRRGLTDRQLVRSIEYVELLDGEAARFGQQDAAFRSSSLGADVADILALSHDIAVRQAATLAMERYQRSLDELGEHLKSSARILVEIATQLGPSASHEGARTSSVLHADSEHELWPFRGEYWRDELGTYRETSISRCRMR